jgi:hypothetical protein
MTRREWIAYPVSTAPTMDNLIDAAWDYMGDRRGGVHRRAPLWIRCSMGRYGGWDVYLIESGSGGRSVQVVVRDAGPLVEAAAWGFFAMIAGRWGMMTQEVTHAGISAQAE